MKKSFTREHVRARITPGITVRGIKDDESFASFLVGILDEKGFREFHDQEPLLEMPILLTARVAGSTLNPQWARATATLQIEVTESRYRRVSPTWKGEKPSSTARTQTRATRPPSGSRTRVCRPASRNRGPR
jgi:hypothetical protein